MISGALDRARALARQDATRVVALLTAWKAAFFAFAFFVLALLPHIFALPIYRQTFHFPSGPPGEWIHFETWDAQHYLYLAEYGYRSGEMSTAFFPLWPYAIKLLAPVFGGSYLFAGLFLANALSIAALALLHAYARDRSGDDSADTTLLIALAYPGAMFFCFAYSEALFVLLAIVAMRALAKDNWRGAVLAAFLLPLCRGIGAFVVVPMAYYLLSRWRRDGRFDAVRALGLLAPIAGVAVYFALMAQTTGDATTGLDAQKFFVGERSLTDLVDVVGLARNFADVAWGHDYHHSILDRLWFVGFVAGLVVLWRRDRLLFWFALPMGLIPPLTGFMSYTRYIVAVFPLFFVAGDVLSGPTRRGPRAIVLGVLVALQAVLVLRHMNNYWAG